MSFISPLFPPHSAILAQMSTVVERGGRDVPDTPKAVIVCMLCAKLEPEKIVVYNQYFFNKYIHGNQIDSQRIWAGVFESTLCK